MIFNYSYNLIDTKDIVNIKKKYLKKINVLDFGCGAGSWNSNNLKIINKVYLYDKNKKLIKILKKKYKNKKIIITFNKKIFFKKDINLIIFSSVIQYINNKELKKIFNKIIDNYKKKKLLILINDHPNLPRIIELLFLPFVNWKKLIYSLTLLNKNYFKIKLFKHKIHNKDYLINNFEFKKIDSSFNIFRKKYLLILKEK
jgi:SAM-dependent methyltransferase